MEFISSADIVEDYCVFGANLRDMIVVGKSDQFVALQITYDLGKDTAIKREILIRADVARFLAKSLKIAADKINPAPTIASIDPPDESIRPPSQ